MIKYFYLCCVSIALLCGKEGLPLYYWQEKFVNFGDYLSLKLVERIVGQAVARLS